MSYCKAIDGPAIGKPCTFPFEYKGTIYHGCTWDSSTLTAKKPWCSTIADKNNGKHKGGIGEWGFCTFECTGMCYQNIH